MNKIVTRLAACALLVLSWPAAAQQEPFERVVPALPTLSGDGVEVLEFFWYGCPHCYSLQPHIAAWQARKPDNVHFRLIAAPLNPSWTMHSRAYYAAETLGVVERFHGPFFDAIHKGRKRMRDDAEIVDFVNSLGLDGKAFRDAMYSDAVNTRMQYAMQLADAYRIGGVPTLTVNGKYKLSAQLAGGYPQMVQVMEQLIAQEQGN